LTETQAHNIGIANSGAGRKYNQQLCAIQFQSRQDKHLSTLELNFIKIIQSAVVPGGRNSNPPPSAIPARYTQAKEGAIRF